MDSLTDDGLGVRSQLWLQGVHQRRLRHLTRCLVRNLSPSEAPPTGQAPSRRPLLARGTSADDLDLELRRRKAQGKKRISLSQATRDRQTTPLTTPTKAATESEPRRISRPRTVSSVSSKYGAGKHHVGIDSAGSRGDEKEADEDDDERDDDVQLLSPLPRMRGRATSRASILSQTSSITVRELDWSSSHAVSRPMPQCCLTLSLPSIEEEKGKGPACFYASDVVHSRNPTFEIDPETFSDCAEHLLRRSRFVAEVWVLPEESTEWSLHLQWDVDLNGMMSIGDDFSAASEVPDDAIIFGLSTGDYVTSPPASILSPLGALPEYSSPASLSDQDDGALSDPGTSEALSRARATKVAETARRKDVERRKRAIEISKRETRMLRSIGIGGIVRLLTLQTCVDDLQRSARQSIDRLNHLVDDPGGLPHLKRQYQGLERLMSDRQRHIADSRQASSTVQDAVRHRAEELVVRRERLETAHQVLAEAFADLEVEQVDIMKQRREYAKLTRALVATRALRIAELDFVFPIRSSDTLLLFSIVEVPLANSDFSDAHDEGVSSALGLTAQLLELLALYLGLPLPYPVACRGSRSLVSDPITGNMRGPRAFPLYSKGVDRIRFDYAVLLLNKDIEHILTLHRPHPIAVPDLKQTLPNLHNLILTATSELYQGSNGYATTEHKLAPPAPIRGSASSSDSATDSDLEGSDNEARAASVRSSASVKTLRPTGVTAKAGDEKRSATTRAAEKLKSLTDGRNASIVQ